MANPLQQALLQPCYYNQMSHQLCNSASPKSPQADVSRMWLWPSTTLENWLKSLHTPSNVQENYKRGATPNLMGPRTTVSRPRNITSISTSLPPWLSLAGPIPTPIPMGSRLAMCLHLSIAPPIVIWCYPSLRSRFVGLHKPTWSCLFSSNLQILEILRSATDGSSKTTV
jgi:hypothetical protein